jgi:pyrimidine-nucleoside phosphorylase
MKTVDIYDIIKKKRDGTTLSADEWAYVITGYQAGDIADYQMASLLMAGFIHGLDENETASLTATLADSGEKLSWPEGPYVDKHSTGGVGDKITLIAVPLAAAAGCKIPKLSGKGLGHTGGTIDKLNSIPGLSTKISVKELRRITDKTGCAIAEAVDIAPADKRLYALRDATATVESIPYITASILSKKIAAGTPNLVFDVKYGSGAFMGGIEEATELAASLVKTGANSGRRCRAVITSMQQPLGNNCGNALEVKEALQVLRGEGPDDVCELSIAIAAEMVYISGICASFEEAEILCNQILDSGKGYEKFDEMIRAQGGVSGYEKKLPIAKVIIPILADITGYITGIDAYAVGRAVALGGGRLKKEDEIDYAVGVVLKCKIGDEVTKDDLIAEIHAGTQGDKVIIASIVKDAIEIGKEPMEIPDIVAVRM